MNLPAPHRAVSVLAAALGCAYSVSAQGVIANDAAILPLFDSGQYLTLTTSLQRRPGLFAIRITSDRPSQFTFSSVGGWEMYALYDVSPRVAIDPWFAATTIPLVSNNGVDPDSSIQTFSLGQSRYYAYWDDRFYDSHVEYGAADVTDYYGWVLITRTVSGLQVSSSATALGGGIVAGELTQIPEPSTGVLFLFGLSASWFWHRHVTPPKQGPPANRRSAGQSDGSVSVSAIVEAARAFPAAVAERGCSAHE